MRYAPPLLSVTVCLHYSVAARWNVMILLPDLESGVITSHKLRIGVSTALIN